MTSDSNQEQLVEHLTRIPLFSDLDDAELAQVAELVVPFQAPAGHVLVQPGIVGSGVFVIEEGTVGLDVKGKHVELGPGEFFGELALLDDRATRTTRVRATTPVKGFCIARDDFSKLIADEPKIAVRMLRVLAHRLVDAVTS